MGPDGAAHDAHGARYDAQDDRDAGDDASGFRRSTIKAIAHACGLGPAGLYYYFGSKAELANYLLALRLPDEIAHVAGGAGNAWVFREGESVFGRLLVAAAPTTPRPDAEPAARDALSAMVVSAVIGLDPGPAGDVRRRVVGVLRMALVPVHGEARRHAAAMRATEQKAASIRDPRP